MSVHTCLCTHGYGHVETHGYTQARQAKFRCPFQAKPTHDHKHSYTHACTHVCPHHFRNFLGSLLRYQHYITPAAHHANTPLCQHYIPLPKCGCFAAEVPFCAACLPSSPAAAAAAGMPPLRRGGVSSSKCCGGDRDSGLVPLSGSRACGMELPPGQAYDVMTYVVMAYVAMAYVVMAVRDGAAAWTGLCSYGLCSHGLCSHGICSYGLCSHGRAGWSCLDSCRLDSHGDGADGARNLHLGCVRVTFGLHLGYIWVTFELPGYIWVAFGLHLGYWVTFYMWRTHSN